METALLITSASTTGTYASTRPHERYGYIGAPQWKEPAADPIADALKAAGENATHLPAQVITDARSVLNLLADLPDPIITVDEHEITLEWYRDRHHVAVVALDGEFISWAVMAGPRNPIKGKEKFANFVTPELYDIICVAAG